MSKRSRKPGPNGLGGTRGRSVGSVDPTEIGKVIYTLDAYRNNIFYDISWIDKLVNERRLGRSFGNEWSSIKKDLFKMARVTSRVPGAVRLARIQSFFEALWQISVPILFIMLFVGLFAPQNPIVGVISPFVMVLAFSALILGVLSRFLIGARIAKKIDEYIEENPEINVIRAKELKQYIQILINELRHYILSTDASPEDHLIGVGLLDYRGIEVVKDSKPWRQYYLVKVDVKEML